MKTDQNDRLVEGKRQLTEMASRYAGQHGLTPRKIRWEERGFDLMMVFEDDNHQVDIPFSVDEVMYFPEDPDKGMTKRKIRDKFAGLSL